MGPVGPGRAAAGGGYAGDGSRVGAAVARVEERGDPAHDQVGRERLLRTCGRGPRRQHVREPGTARPTRIVAWPPRRGTGRPFGQTRSVFETPIGTIVAFVRSASIARPSFGRLELAGRAARALREDHQDLAGVEDPLGEPERLDVGGAAVDRDDAAVAGHPADDRPVEHLASCRASGSAGRAAASATRR